jgi:hypothetical protein
MQLERLKADRALTIIPPPGLALAAMPVMTNSGVCLRLMPTDNDDEQPDTIRPPAGNTSVLPPPPEGTSTLEEIAKAEEAPVEEWAGYDESKFMHRATAAIVNGTNALLKAKQEWDIPTIVQRQRVLFEEAIVPKLNSLATRLDGDIGELRRELAAMKIRVSEIEVALGLRTK